MKGWLFIMSVIIAVIVFTYNPATKTLTGEVLYVEENELHITCPQKQPRFKPADDIGYSCTILINEDTIIESNKKIEQGQTVAVELVRKTKNTAENVTLIAKNIKIIE